MCTQINEYRIQIIAVNCWEPKDRISSPLWHQSIVLYHLNSVMIILLCTFNTWFAIHRIRIKLIPNILNVVLPRQPFALWKDRFFMYDIFSVCRENYWFQAKWGRYSIFVHGIKTKATNWIVIWLPVLVSITREPYVCSNSCVCILFLATEMRTWSPFY